MIEFFKVVCQVVCLERNDAGDVIGERLAEPVAIYNTDGLAEFIEKVQTEIKVANGGSNGSVVVPQLEVPHARG